jgi:hypothetical protein
MPASLLHVALVWLRLLQKMQYFALDDSTLCGTVDDHSMADGCGATHVGFAAPLVVLIGGGSLGCLVDCELLRLQYAVSWVVVLQRSQYLGV